MQNQHWKAFVMQAQGARQCVLAHKVFETGNGINYASARSDWLLDEWPSKYLSNSDQWLRTAHNKAADTALPEDVATVKRRSCADKRHDKQSEIHHQPDSETSGNTQRTIIKEGQRHSDDNASEERTQSTYQKQPQDPARKSDPSFNSKTRHCDVQSINCAQPGNVHASPAVHLSKPCQTIGDSGLPRCPKKIKNCNAVDANVEVKQSVCSPAESGTDREQTEGSRQDPGVALIDSRKREMKQIETSVSVVSTNINVAREKNSGDLRRISDSSPSKFEYTGITGTEQVTNDLDRKRKSNQKLEGSRSIDKCRHKEACTGVGPGFLGQVGVSDTSLGDVDTAGPVRTEADPQKAATAKHLHASKPSSKLQQNNLSIISEGGKGRAKGSVRSSDEGKHLKGGIKGSVPNSTGSSSIAGAARASARSIDGHTDKAHSDDCRFPEEKRTATDIAQEGKTSKDLRETKAARRSPLELGSLTSAALADMKSKLAGTTVDKKIQNQQQERTKILPPSSGSESCKTSANVRNGHSVAGRGLDAEGGRRQREPAAAPLSAAGEAPPGWSRHWSKTWGAHYLFNARTGEQRWESGGPEKRIGVDSASGGRGAGEGQSGDGGSGNVFGAGTSAAKDGDRSAGAATHTRSRGLDAEAGNAAPVPSPTGAE